MSSIPSSRVDGLAGLARPAVDFGGNAGRQAQTRSSGEWFGFGQWSGASGGAGFSAQPSASGASIADLSRAVLSPIVD